MIEKPSFPVSIHCITYNHAAFIEDAMNGFVIQQTSFPFVAIIIDDASIDGEPAVLENYFNTNFDSLHESDDESRETDEARFLFGRHKQNHNCYFAIVLLKINYFSQKKSKSSFYEIWERDTKYIALCEGDDYWTDPIKLQRQVDFLDSHADYSMCFHKAIEHWESSDKEDNVFSDVEDRDYSGPEIFDKWTVPTASVVLIKSVLNSDKYQKAMKNEKFYYGDIILFLCCSCYGKMRGFSSIMSVYRRHIGSMLLPDHYCWQNQVRFAYHCLEVYHFFGKDYKKSATSQFFYQSIQPFYYSRNVGATNYYLLFSLIRYEPFKTLLSLVNKIREKCRRKL